MKIFLSSTYLDLIEHRKAAHSGVYNYQEVKHD